MQKLDDRIDLLVDGPFTQRSDNFNLSQAKGISTNNVSKDMNRSASSLNLHPDLSLNKSRSLPMGTNQNRVRGMSDPSFPGSIESSSSSSNSDQSLMNDTIYLRSYQSLPVESTNFMNNATTINQSFHSIALHPDNRSHGMPIMTRGSLSPYVSIEYVPRPK